MKPFNEIRQELRDAGADVFDHIDPEEYMRFLRDDVWDDEPWTCCDKELEKYFVSCPSCGTKRQSTGLNE